MKRHLLIAGLLLLSACAPATQSAQRLPPAPTGAELFTETTRAVAALSTSVPIEVPLECKYSEKYYREKNILAGKPYGNFAYLVDGSALETIEQLTAVVQTRPDIHLIKWNKLSADRYSGGAFVNREYPVSYGYFVNLDIYSQGPGKSVICGDLVFL